MQVESALGIPLIAGSRPRPRVLEVSELARYIGGLFDADPFLQEVWLRGEVSNFSRSTAGHCYFTLKDDVGQLRCVLFRGAATRSPLIPSNGQSVVAHGSVRFYERQGTCELIADLVFAEGMGLAQMQFEALYRRLEGEGLFEPARKRPLPRFPRRIGIVSSEGGAVIHDLLTVLERRYPIGEVAFLPARVQGDGAGAEIAVAVRALCLWLAADGGGVDVLVVARGGGSVEDLAPFNDETLVRAIYASRVPVVSAVGHETDVTLSDLVADLRAPTPSAAAELISPDLSALPQEMAGARRLAAHAVGLEIASAQSACRVAREAILDEVTHVLGLAREQIRGRRLQLEALSPDATLGRGYAVVESGGRVLTDATDVAVGDDVEIQLRRGRLGASVREVSPA